MPELSSAQKPKWPKRGVIGVISRADKFLVIRRSKFVTAPLKICLPGGTIEKGEEESETLVREMQEELSIDVLPVRCCFRSETPWGTQLAWWVAQLDPDVVPIACPEEVDEYFWWTIEEIRDAKNTLPSLGDFFRAVESGSIDVN